MRPRRESKDLTPKHANLYSLGVLYRHGRLVDFHFRFSLDAPGDAVGLVLFFGDLPKYLENEDEMQRFV